MRKYNDRGDTANVKGKTRRSMSGLDVINPGTAGLDLHKAVIVACAPMGDGDSRPPVTRFGTCTCDLRDLAVWLKEKAVTTVAMEATGVFWLPVIDHLRSAGLEVLLVNARDVKSVKGRPKTDKLDSEWIRRLHACGLLRGSFIPDPETAALKNLWRQHLNMEEEATRSVQRMQKSLQMMNIRLDIAVTDITGETGIRIIDAILSGEREPRNLAKLRDPRMAKSEREVAAALDGNFRDDLVFVLRECLLHYRFPQERIVELDKFMTRFMAGMEKKVSASDIPKAKKSDRNSPDASFTRERLFELLGVDLTQIKGVGILTATSFLVNAGRDMSPWPTDKHFVSWLALSPNARDSGGKKKHAATKKTSSALAHSLRMAVMSIGRLDSWLGACYRRLKARIGAPKAITAIARKLAIIFYHAVKDGAGVKSLDAEAYELAHRERTLKYLRRKAAAHGFELTPVEAAMAS